MAFGDRPALTVRVEGRGDDAHGAIREQLLRADLRHARPVDGLVPARRFRRRLRG